MSVTTADTGAPLSHRRIAGLPVASWAFALRVWLAMLLALYVSFWLQLASPFSAAVTVAILALPTRGQAIEKALFRFIATAIGVAASIAIAGTFSQTSALLLCAFSVWIGLCAYVAGLFDGNRSYAAALCCITVALVAIQDIDSPQQIFSTGTARGAAIIVGIFASALVNDLLAVPDYHPILSTRFAALCDRVAGYAAGLAAPKTASSTTAARLLHDLVELRPEIASLFTESSSGHARSAAARTAMVDLVLRVHLIGAYASLLSTRTLDSSIQHGDTARLLSVTTTWLRTTLDQNGEVIDRNLQNLSIGAYPERRKRAPIYRSHRIAIASGLRSAIHFAIISAFFVVMGWPSTSLCLALVAIMIGFGSTAPDARSFMIVAMIAAPIACVMGGIIKYGVLNGVSQFELLAIGLMPFIIGPAILITLANRMLALLGRLILIFMIVILGPSNPQTYDPETFLVTCLFACLSTILPFIAHLLLPPWSNKRRLCQLMKESHRQLAQLNAARSVSLRFDEAIFRDAMLVALIVNGSAGCSEDQPLVDAMRFFNQIAALRISEGYLRTIPTGPLEREIDAAKSALMHRNPNAIAQAAKTLLRAADKRGVLADSACASLVLASIALTPRLNSWT